VKSRATTPSSIAVAAVGSIVEEDRTRKDLTSDYARWVMGPRSRYLGELAADGEPSSMS
jgi:hypothetical protein